jgi:hypothetical protein
MSKTAVLCAALVVAVSKGDVVAPTAEHRLARLEAESAIHNLVAT